MGDQRNSIPGSQIHRRAASSRNSECRYRQRFRLETMPRNHLHPGATGAAVEELRVPNISARDSGRLEGLSFGRALTRR
ncbi:uncharacterized protein LOC112343031 isoform X3 [Selaginella moellendorffii]|nr:uncharacterized protein LOC112343031 isoform X3 [Selaginella moellendorffii]|eukprot:XP_024521596.1 uncharacterized protein LOC112343031 isoform X3 [Selaginella moellendorffii]